jgi:putative transposase
MEAFFSTVKNEVGEWFDSHADAKAKLFDYVEVFYNHQRRHSSAGRMSPAAYERKTTQAA